MEYSKEDLMEAKKQIWEQTINIILRVMFFV